MKFSKQIGVSALIAATLAFTGCTQDQENLAAAAAVVGTAAVVVGANSDGSHKNDYYHNNHNYGENRNYSYRQGVREGCDSASGRWNQDGNRLDRDKSYKNGWEAGYRRCK